MSITDRTLDHSAFTRDWEEWHGSHEVARTDAHGFLAVTGLYWITGEPKRLPDAPGSWQVTEEGPVVELDEGESLRIDGRRLTGRHVLDPIAERGSVLAEFDGGVLEIALRGGQHILRPRRPDHGFLGVYSGTPAFAPDVRWVKPARFLAFDEPRATEVGAAVEGLSHVYESPGSLEFDHEGQVHRLTAFPGKEAGSLLVLFTDATSGITTYSANRSLGVAAPGPDGATVLDFNRATNLPCAYTDFATCPLPPAENRLPIAVEAGEKTPVERVEGQTTEVGIVALP